MPTQHSGSVYEHRSKNNWKETWLCLENDGALTWKRKDAYQVKGRIYLDRQLLNQIEIDGWPSKKCGQNNNEHPFSIQFPLEIQGSKTKKKLYVKDGDSLDLWLDAFATVMGKWKLWKNVKQRQEDKERGNDENNGDPSLKYQMLVQFYKTTWQEFLRSYDEKGDGVEENCNGRVQNGFVARQQQTMEILDAPTTSMANGGPTNNKRPPINDSVVVTHVQLLSVNGATSGRVIQNGGTASRTDKKEGDDSKLYGEEDSAEEEHF